MQRIIDYVYLLRTHAKGYERGRMHHWPINLPDHREGARRLASVERLPHKRQLIRLILSICSVVFPGFHDRHSCIVIVIFVKAALKAK
jgi:hypothetical protein